MAAPFLYVQPSSPPYPPPYYCNPYFPTSQAGPSFLPPSLPLYPCAPYVESSALPGWAKSFNPNSVLWPEDPPPYWPSSAAPWVPFQSSPRKKSWKASPFLAPSVPAFLNAAGTGRSQTARHIHPFLNGDAPSPAFHFDLARSPSSGALIGLADLHEPAFHPPLFALRIAHPRLPFGPVDIALPAPITLWDVLVALQHTLHTRITHADWATLGSKDEAAVARAFTSRCRAEALRSGAAPAELHDRENSIRRQGVMRVDFLLGETVLKGLVRTPGAPEGCMRMITG